MNAKEFLAQNKKWILIAFGVICVLSGIFYIFGGKIGLPQNIVHNYSIQELKGRPYKVPLFDKKIVTLESGKMKFEDSSKEFSLEQFAPIASYQDTIILPIKLSNSEGKSNYFLTLYVKEGNNFNQRQNVLLGAVVEDIKLEFNKEILRVRYNTKDRNDALVAEEKFYNTKDGKISPYFPYIDNGAIDLSIIRNTWNWKKTQYGRGEINNSSTGAFDIRFDENGNFSSTSDCKDITGRFVMSGKGEATFGNVVSSDFSCKDTLAKKYANMLLDAQSFTFTGSTLTLGLKSNSGSMIFESR